jgi:hypothetical protein
VCLLRIILSVEHPAWAHQFRYVIKELEKKGHTFKVVAINKDRDLELLDAFGIPYDVISNTSGKNIIEKGFIFLWTTFQIFLVSAKFKPDLFIGRASPMMAINSFVFRKPHIVFEDTEHSNFCLKVCTLFSDVIMTPVCFIKKLGKKQLRIDSYKELFYLHSNYYQPNPATLSELGLTENDHFIILRFVAWDAHHDIGQHGITDKVKFVKKIEKYGQILITSEGSIPPELEQYQIPVSPEKLHDLLYYATLYMGDGGTTASEAAMLGTPSIFISTLSGTMGNFIELEKTYNLLYSFIDENAVLGMAVEILKNPDSKKNWRIKREQLLRKKVDVSAFMIWFIENYPQSFTDIKGHPELQYHYVRIPIDGSLVL